MDGWSSMHKPLSIEEWIPTIRTKVAVPAYHGYLQLLRFLLVAVGVRIDDEEQEHAVLAAVRNGQHDALQMVLRKRLDEVKTLVQRESDSHNRMTTLGKAFQKEDLACVQMLRLQAGAQLSDPDYRVLAPDAISKKREKGHLCVILKAMYPTLHDSIWNWSKTTHWTFPTSDRQMLNWLWHTFLHSFANTQQGSLPAEVLLRIFSFVGRGWWVDLK
jgi:hypothetical protein